MGYGDILNLMRATQSDPILSRILRKIFQDQAFWYQKLSMEKIKTFVDPYVNWHRVYKFLYGDLRGDDLSRKKLILAACNGFLDELKILILNSVDPSTQDNDAIVIASVNGHLEVVNRLLEDPRVNPCDRGNYAIRFASRSGHLAVVNRLLQDPKVDPSFRNNDAVRLASENGRLAVVD